jgi:hypothetical protein
MRNSNWAYCDSLANKKPKTTHYQRAYSMRAAGRHGWKPTWNMRERGAASLKKLKMPVDSTVTLIPRLRG